MTSGKTVALAFKLWSDPFVGRLVFCPRLPGQAGPRPVALQSPHPPQRADFAPAADARDGQGGDRRRLRRRHLRRGRREGCHHRGHPCATTSRTSGWSRRPSPSRSSRCPSSRNQRPTRKRWAPPSSACPPRIRPSERFTDTGYGPGDHRRDGRTPPGDHPRPHVPRIQGRGRRRQAADRLSREHHRARRRRGQVHPPVGRPRPVRPRRDQARTEREGQGRRGHQRDRGRRDSEGIHQAHHRRHPRRPPTMASSPAIPSSISRPRSSMVRSTRWTRRNSPSGWPAFSPSRTPWRRPGRSFWSRS